MTTLSSRKHLPGGGMKAKYGDIDEELYVSLAPRTASEWATSQWQAIEKRGPSSTHEER